MTKFKNAQVIMLPTQEKGRHNDLIINPTTKQLFRFEHQNCTELSNHLYIISDDNIEVGDYVYNIKFNDIYQITHSKESIVFNTEKYNYIKKVIATTNKHLVQPKKVISRDEIGNIYNAIYLPQPSDSFITKYIDSYNQNNVITDVLVEYETVSNGINSDNTDLSYIHKLKINDKFNTITIKEIKNSYSRKEVIELCESAWQVGFNVGYNDENSPSYVTANDWIIKNL